MMSVLPITLAPGGVQAHRFDSDQPHGNRAVTACGRRVDRVLTLAEINARFGMLDECPTCWPDKEERNTVELTRPCTREGCPGTMIPAPDPAAHFDWDGSAMIATCCSWGCGMTSTATFTWEGYDSSEHDQALARTYLYDRLIDIDGEHGDEMDERTHAVLDLAIGLLRQPRTPVPTIAPKEDGQ